ncbi:MAG: arsenate reductase ArsC [Candidatus Zixiibacteriota bacterium]
MNLLFICAGNAVRSQMAEGWARALADGRHEVTSAGIDAGGVHPRAVETMRQAGIDISQHGTRRISDDLFHWADYIITLADSVKPYSVYFPESAAHLHWSIPNPDAMYAPGLSVDDAYAEVRDDIKRRIEKLLTSLTI